jgi:glycogen(starch) synthase
MRVLFWSLTFWPAIGGMEVLASKLLPSLRRRGHELLVIAPKIYGGAEEGTYKGIPVRWIPFQNTSSSHIDHIAAVRSRVADLKRAFAPDLIHVNGVGATDFFHLTTRHASDAPVLVTLHGEWLPKSDTVVAQTLRHADWVVGCSGAILNRGRQLSPEIESRCSVVYNGVELPSAVAPPASCDRPHVLYLGRLAAEKGVDLGLTAFRSIVERVPDARLTVAGDGPDRVALEAWTAREGLGHAVDFIGWVLPEDVPALIERHSIVLMPSRQDSFPLAAIEAALMGRPVVATRVGGLPELVLHEETGLLCEAEDPLAVADSVVQLLNDPSRAAALGRAAWRRAREVFAWQRHVDSYDALYRRLARR